jgi:hypothetical protein
MRSATLRCGAAIPLALALLGAVPAPADDRPTEVPYETPGDLPSIDPAYRMTNHKVVLITRNALNPHLVTLDEGQLVAWISYSPIASVVVFEREVARSMVCHSLVNFSLQDDELRSAPIQAGEFASFCELKPGHYRYKIVRPDAGKSPIDASRRLEGEIVVGNPGSVGAATRP